MYVQSKCMYTHVVIFVQSLDFLTDDVEYLVFMAAFTS